MLTADDYKPLRRFNANVAAAPHDTVIMGQIKGTHRHVAVRWSEEKQTFLAIGLTGEPPVEIISWLGFLDFADLKRCVWSETCPT